MASDLLARKSTHFVLWRSRNTTPAPRLIIGRFQPGDPPAFIELPPVALRQSPAAPDLWEIPAGACGLEDGQVYHYWFEVLDSNPYLANRQLIRCTDPTAWTVDWRLLALPLPAPYREHDRDPAGVVKFSAGRLVPCDPGGEEVDWSGDRPLHVLPTNNRLVIYELPTAWARIAATDAAGRHETQIGVGTFRDVIALIDRDHAGANFAGCCALEAGRAHLADLGVNALELLPPADSFVDREWGYATSNYFAADYDLGIPTGQAAPTASTDLVNLVKICHQHGLRFFADMVLAFATRYSYQNVNYLDFHVQAGAGDPEEFDQGTRRDAFGGDLFKYNFWTEAYDPVSGRSGQRLVPARRLMHAHLARWMLDFRIDGIRLDSVKSIANWDVVQEVRDHAHALWRSRWPGADDAHEARIGHVSHDAESRFLVIGEELAVPMALLAQNRLDGLWNEHFKRLVRRAITGRGDEHEASFEWAVREMIDCRLLGFRDGTQAVNYVTSHDVEGFGNERLFNFLNNSSITDTEPRIKLAFACLMTAVGIPMIFAGEEFADEHDRRVRHPEKQVDPVNFDRVEDPWRRRIYEYVARLVKFRTTSEALAVNDTDFIHADFTEGKRVVVWRRGQAARAAVVVVVANFSDWGSDVGNPRAEYVVPNWPATPPGMRWREISQDREVPVEWIGREPLYPWEAKVYALV